LLNWLLCNNTNHHVKLHSTSMLKFCKNGYKEIVFIKLNFSYTVFMITGQNDLWAISLFCNGSHYNRQIVATHNVKFSSTLIKRATQKFIFMRHLYHESRNQLKGINQSICIEWNCIIKSRLLNLTGRISDLLKILQSICAEWSLILK